VHWTYGTSGGTGDVLNRVEAINDDSSGSPGSAFSEYTYLGSAWIVVEDYVQPDVRLTLDSGTAGEYAGLDRFGRVVDHLWYDYGASTDRDRFTYGYDRASSRLYRENTVASGKDEYYAYDEVNRLATFDRGDLNVNKDAISGTPVKEEDWGLDMTGNWTDFLQKTSGTTDLNQDRAHNPVNEITGITETTGTAWIDPVHDRAGNMTTLPKPSSLASGLTCKWDAWNRLVEVKDGATVVAVYEYDGLARRVKSHVDSQSPGNPDGVDAYIHFFYNQGWQELESRVSASENTEPESLQPQYQYVWSQRYIDAPVLRDANTDTDGLCDDERLYYLGDANFNVTTLIDTSGDALERYVYTPYGVLTIYDATWSNIRSASSYANVYTYTGRQLDAETGLYYYRARFLSSQLGHFVNRDPIGYEGDISLYRYTGNSPVVWMDPDGLRTCKWAGAMRANFLGGLILGRLSFKVEADGTDGSRTSDGKGICYWHVKGEGVGWFQGWMWAIGWAAFSADCENLDAPCEWPLKPNDLATVTFVGVGGNAIIPVTGNWVKMFAGHFQAESWFSIGGVNLHAAGGGFMARLTDVTRWRGVRWLVPN